MLNYYIIDRVWGGWIRRNQRPLDWNFMANLLTIFLFTLGLTLIATGTQKIWRKNSFCNNRNHFRRVVYVFTGVAEKRLYLSSIISCQFWGFLFTFSVWICNTLHWWENLWNCNVYLFVNFFVKSQHSFLEFRYLTSF